MAEKINFFESNIIDLNQPDITITITDAVATDTGQINVDFMRNRSNDSAWITTGSTDAANTEILVDMSDPFAFTDILLVGHNFKDFTIQHFDGATFIDFSTPINETGNTDDTTHFHFDSVASSQIKIIVTATQVVDFDKKITQLIITNGLSQPDIIGGERSGQLKLFPLIKPTHDTNKRNSKMLSGKINVVESVGAFKADLNLRFWRNERDFRIIEELYFGRRAVLMWLSGGDEDQFFGLPRGYRNRDIFVVRATNSYKPEYDSAIYSNGLKLRVILQEAIK